MQPGSRLSRVLSLSVALLGAGGAAIGQEPRPMTLDEAIGLGLQRNPAVQASRAEREAAGAAQREARAQRWPRLAAEAGWRRTNNQVLVFSDTLTSATFTAADFALDSLNDPEAENHASAAVGLEVPLYTSGRLGAEIGAARAAAAGAAARQRAAEADLVLQITEAYYGVAVARAAVGVVESALADARQHEAVADARVGTGAALGSDLLRARVERLARERDLERRRADLEIARARLRLALALPPGEAIEPATALADPEEPLEGLESYAAAAIAARPEIEAARRRAEAAEAAARSARAGLGPDIAGTARYERNADAWDAGEGSYVVGVALRWNAFDRGRAAHIDAAAARAAAAQAWSRAAGDAARLEAEAAYRDAEVAGRSLALAAEAAAAAGEARRINAERYAAGLLRLTDLLDAETALVAARFAEINARYDAVVGRVRLRRAAGLLRAPGTEDDAPGAVEMTAFSREVSR